MNPTIQNEGYEDISWYTKIGRLRRAYAELAPADLNYEQKHRGRMIEALMSKLNVTKKEIDSVMDDRAQPAR